MSWFGSESISNTHSRHLLSVREEYQDAQRNHQMKPNWTFRMDGFGPRKRQTLLLVIQWMAVRIYIIGIRVRFGCVCVYVLNLDIFSIHSRMLRTFKLFFYIFPVDFLCTFSQLEILLMFNANCFLFCTISKWIRIVCSEWLIHAIIIIRQKVLNVEIRVTIENLRANEIHSFIQSVSRPLEFILN